MSASRGLAVVIGLRPNDGFGSSIDIETGLGRLAFVLLSACPCPAMSSPTASLGEPPGPEDFERIAGISSSIPGLPGGDVLATLESPPMTDSVNLTFFKAAMRDEIANGWGAPGWLFLGIGWPVRTVDGSVVFGGTGGVGSAEAVTVLSRSSDDRLA